MIQDYFINFRYIINNEIQKNIDNEKIKIYSKLFFSEEFLIKISDFRLMLGFIVIIGAFFIVNKMKEKKDTVIIEDRIWRKYVNIYQKKNIFFKYNKNIHILIYIFAGCLALKHYIKKLKYLDNYLINYLNILLNNDIVDIILWISIVLLIIWGIISYIDVSLYEKKVEKILKRLKKKKDKNEKN